MDFRILALIATVIDACKGVPEPKRGHPTTETVRVLAILRQFLRDGTPWRGLKPPQDQASGSTVRRHREDWAEIGLGARGHALLVGMLRGNPDLSLESCRVRAKRGGDLTGPNPTDRAKAGSKYHLAVTGDGVPVACATSAANVNDTVLFERLFLAGFAVLARRRTGVADKGYDAERHRHRCREFGAAGNSGLSPAFTSAEPRRDRGWASGAGRSNEATLGFSKTTAWPCDTIASASSSSPCFRPPASS